MWWMLVQWWELGLLGTVCGSAQDWSLGKSGWERAEGCERLFY